MAWPERYARLEGRLAALDAAGQRRRLRCLVPTGPTTGLLDGRPVHVFCSNDYLGLAHDPAVLAAWTRAGGAGAGSARLISGDRPAHRALEERLGDLYGRPATLLSSGYHANLALLTTLLSRGDTVASDARNHASIIDGVRLSGAEKAIVPHNRPEQVPASAHLAVIEGLYSMDGDRAEVARWQADRRWLMVDEAHAFGTIGPGGRGVAAAQGVEPDFVVATLGKAAGSYGAFVIGPPVLRELLLSAGRTFIFTTGLPEPAAAAALAALDRMADGSLQERLADNTRRLRAGLRELGFEAPGEDHIVPLILGPAAMPAAEALLAAGYYAAGIRPPTVPAGQERIRLSLSAAHTAEQIDGLLEALGRAVLSLR